MFHTVPVRPRGDAALVIAASDERAPAVATEARALAELMPWAETAIGPDATSALLRSRAGGAGLLHIACHGLYRPDNPLFSALRLADRWVTAAEVLDLDLGGALVTLSACESGRPGYGAAEPVGLAWAFLAAGASGAIVSQWVVNDRSTAALMSRLYRRLTAGDPPAQALRRAQLETAAEHHHPYFWAPFTYVGFPASSRNGASA
jgi:CHAT domain-containing protein